MESQLAHFADLLGTRITVDGPEVSIGAAAAQALGIAIHELATNAGKYGALSSDAGTVAIGWTLDGDEFRVTWRETGGPAVEPPRKHGFGSLAISRLSELALAAKVVFEFRSEGVSWSLTCDKQNVLQG